MARENGSPHLDGLAIGVYIFLRNEKTRKHNVGAGFIKFSADQTGHVNV